MYMYICMFNIYVRMHVCLYVCMCMYTIYCMYVQYVFCKYIGY